MLEKYRQKKCLPAWEPGPGTRSILEKCAAGIFEVQLGTWKLETSRDTTDNCKKQRTVAATYNLKR